MSHPSRSVSVFKEVLLAASSFSTSNLERSTRTSQSQVVPGYFPTHDYSYDLISYILTPLFVSYNIKISDTLMMSEVDM